MLTKGAGVLRIARYTMSTGIHNPKIRAQLVTSASGSVLPEPKKPRFVFLHVVLAVATGMFVGATISKNIANFLEENELFIPTDDDDDD